MTDCRCVKRPDRYVDGRSEVLDALHHRIQVGCGTVERNRVRAVRLRSRRRDDAANAPVHDGSDGQQCARTELPL